MTFDDKAGFAMKELHAIFAGDPQHDVPLVGGSDALRSQWFREAQRMGTVGARPIIGLWCVDKSVPQEDVIEIYGSVPIDIKARYDHWRRMQH
jgi:hypothetical protein